jgi:hypothetical protein
MPSATHGRWYTRDVDDTITNLPDASPGAVGVVDFSAVDDLSIDGGGTDATFFESDADGGLPGTQFFDEYDGGGVVL